MANVSSSTDPSLSELEFLKKELEAKNRELEIEAALEKVRAKTLAMRKSEELMETSHLLFEQFRESGDIAQQITIGIFNEEDDTAAMSATLKGEKLFQVVISLNEPIVMQKIYNSWKSKQRSVTIDISGEQLSRYNEYRNKLRGEKLFPVDVSEKDHWIVNAANFSKGIISFSGPVHQPPETIHLLERFADVFDLTYTRFLDLQKAESSAREAQIEVSLQKVRAVAMAMMNPSDLLEVCKIVFHELKLLGFEHIRNAIIGIFEKEKSSFLDYDYSDFLGGTITKISENDHPLIQKHMQNVKHASGVLSEVIIKESELAGWIEARRNRGEPDDPRLNNIKSLYYYFYSLGSGVIGISVYEKMNEDELGILKRFRNEFDLAYKRYEDISNAEIQKQEALIEASLERVRAKTMAMHNSQEVGETVSVMFEELTKLGIETIRCGIGIMHEPSDMEVWTARINEEGRSEMIIGMLDMNLHPLLRGGHNGWKEKKESFSYELKGDDLVSYFDAINNHPDYPIRYDISGLPRHIYHNEFYFNEGTLYSFSVKPVPEEHQKVLKRFANVFGQTYRRYLDLLKAEEQAREAQIEASLERVRSKAMAMHSSSDLNDAVAIVFEQLIHLKLDVMRCGIGIMNRERRTADVWVTTITDTKTAVQVTGDESFDIHPLLINAFAAWERQEDFSYELKGQDMVNYYKAVSGTNFHLPESQIIRSVEPGKSQYYWLAPFEAGALFAFADHPFTEDAKKIMRRFSNVFNLTYKRFQDIQKAEISAKDALRQSSIDRIRAEIASMRTKDDLQKITPLIWKELHVLQVPFVRCGIFIMNEADQQMRSFLSTPDGNAIASFNLSFDSTENIRNMVSSWRLKKTYSEYWSEREFEEFADLLKEQEVLFPTSPYWDSLPKKGIYLHYIPFMQGMLYVGNSEKLNDEQLKLLEDVSGAFSAAYSRYDDFSRLEIAKQEVDKALVELKQAQAQLVQSEKMASLGELTAGIAHEIQNPLNFVNNFSEVSNELLDEMNSELERGAVSDAKQIAGDVKQNMEKILFHGKRADAIVKGMLQHSRASSGQKEMTDINALADEYIRLSFHGLRAKNKSFHANYKCDFDETIGKINIIPQDIGRALLNLVNNAFYAVTERKKLNENGFDPMVIISTRKNNKNIEISVKDNGNGIPSKILEKIFQPFFTTKPTGQGTGLGLSLSYDIITKGHNGELKVETKEGQGTQFIILLPA